jgi:hypothetical protein
MILTSPLADALLVPVRYRQGRTQLERIQSLDRIADPLLGIAREKGECAWIRTAPIDGHLFITKDGNDTLLFPLNSPFRGRPRYQWLDGPDGIRRGHLVPEARNDRRESEA